MKLLKIFALLPVTLFTASAALAQVYQSTMPDGSVVFGDKPAPGAAQVKELSPPQNLNVIPPVPTAPPAEDAVTARQHQMEAADLDVDTARRRLETEKAALEAGREPEPGERIGTATGHSRLQDTYFERIKLLEAAVATAQQQLDAAIARRDALLSPSSADQ